MLLAALAVLLLAGVLLAPSFGGAAPPSRAGAGAGAEVSAGGTNAQAQANAQAILRPRLLPRPVCDILRSLGLNWVIQLLRNLGVRPCASP